MRLLVTQIVYSFPAMSLPSGLMIGGKMLPLRFCAIADAGMCRP